MAQYYVTEKGYHKLKEEMDRFIGHSTGEPDDVQRTFLGVHADEGADHNSVVIDSERPTQGFAAGFVARFRRPDGVVDGRHSLFGDAALVGQRTCDGGVDRNLGVDRVDKRS